MYEIHKLITQNTPRLDNSTIPSNTPHYGFVLDLSTNLLNNHVRPLAQYLCKNHIYSYFYKLKKDNTPYSRSTYSYWLFLYNTKQEAELAREYAVQELKNILLIKAKEIEKRALSLV